MARYSGKHLFIFCAVSVAFTLLLVGLLNWLLGTGQPPVKTAVANIAVMPTIPPLELQTSPNDLKQVANASDYTEDERNNITVYEAVNEAVVNVSTEVMNYSLFFDPVPEKGATGSGSIIDKRGFILTNRHVIEGANKLYVTLASGDRLEAKIIGVDAENDLAVIQIDPAGRDLKTIGLGASANLKVGQKVIAIGNPFSFDRTMTVGIVSGLRRPIRTDNDLILQGMIQTDASINPGNSGGPLLDSRGNLIGINTMIYSPSGGSVGVGFAVPVDTARRVVPDLMKYGSVKRGWIDISPIQIFPELVRYANLAVGKGILISKLDAGGAAAAAGLHGGDPSSAVRYGRTVMYLGGDIIVQVGSTATETIADLYSALETTRPGETVKVVYLRGGSRRETTVTLVERPTNASIE
jgi:S1-C subfamily serine protease